MKHTILLAALLTCQLAQAQQKKPSIGRLMHVTVFVRDYSEALKWYTEKLGLEKTADQPFGSDERWVTVAPQGQTQMQIVLAKAKGGTADLIGKQSHWVFETDDCQKTYEMLVERGVKFAGPPEKLPWGTQAMFEDLYGNRFILMGGR